MIATKYIASTIMPPLDSLHWIARCHRRMWYNLLFLFFKDSWPHKTYGAYILSGNMASSPQAVNNHGFVGKTTASNKSRMTEMKISDNCNSLRSSRLLIVSYVKCGSISMTKWLRKATGNAINGSLIATATRAPVNAWLIPVTNLSTRLFRRLVG